MDIRAPAADSRETGIYIQEIAADSRAIETRTQEIAADSREMTIHTQETALYRPTTPPQPWKRLPAARFSTANIKKSVFYADSLQK